MIFRQWPGCVVRLGVVLGALVILTGCAAKERFPTGPGVLLFSWTPPAENTEGTPTTEVASYQVYFNTTGFPCPGGRSVKVDARAVAPARDGRVSAVLTTLVVGQVYYVAMTAVNVEGGVSACSNIISAPARWPWEK